MTRKEQAIQTACERFERLSKELHEVYDDVVLEPVPQKLLDTIKDLK